MRRAGCSPRGEPVHPGGCIDRRLFTAGDLDAGVCRRCGYVELYCTDPEKIPIDGVYVRELVGPG